MLIYDICSRSEYEINGEKKIRWFRVGVLKVNEKGKMYIRLFQQPDTQFFVFKPQEKPEGTPEENQS